MQETTSSQLLAGCRGQDETAAATLFDRYVARLTALARSRLARSLAARVDAEDVVQSAYRSFFLLARRGDIVLHEQGDLWRLLARITLRKVSRAARRHHAAGRSVRREHADVIDEALSREPTPVEAAALVDEVRSLLLPLGPLQRRIVEMRLQGHDAHAIARSVRRSARTVRRTLAAVGTELARRWTDAIPAATTGLLRYEDIVLERLIGQGGMGKVYRARWHGHAGWVAVKLLRKPLRRHRDAVDRFREEARLLGLLRHPGIVSLHGVGLLPDGGHFLVLDLVEGAHLGQQPSPSIEQAVGWVAEAAEAIEHAHRLGIVHCDLKPSNLLLGSDGRVRVTDFGFARMLSGSSASVGGTAGFMAPEQRDGVVSSRTDVFGLGAVLRALLPERPPELEAVCARCTAIQPSRRYDTALELAKVLRDYLPERR